MTEGRLLGRKVHFEDGHQHRRGGADIGPHDDRHGVFQAQQSLLREDNGQPGGHRTRLHYRREQAADSDGEQGIVRLGQVAHQCRVVVQRLHGGGNQVEAEKHEADVENGLAENSKPRPCQGEQETENDKHRGKGGKLERHQLRGDRRAHVGAKNDAHTVLERQHPRIDQADGDHRGGGAGLDDCGHQGTYQESQQGNAGCAAQEFTETLTGYLLNFRREVLQAEDKENDGRQTSHAYLQIFHGRGNSSLAGKSPPDIAQLPADWPVPDHGGCSVLWPPDARE